MCLQSIGEVIRQVDDRTEGRLFSLYPTTPWKQIIGMRNIISHEYLSIDPELVLDITRSELHPLLTDIRRILADIDAGLRDNELREG
ncbi:HepT-like ribonuclease domain-containing protein [uncultured Bacteroides sp.]